MAALNQILLSQKLQSPAQRAQCYPMLGCEACLGWQGRASRPLARNDAMTQRRGERRIPALPGSGTTSRKGT
jgi:hypothetical protein